MKKGKKVKLRGFTLVELIVVIAVFGILLAAALSLLGPVNNVFRATVSYADGSAMVDNVSKYVEDNLRYSNRLWVYDSVTVGNEDLFVSKYTQDMVNAFHLKDAKKVSMKVNDEKIYVMKIDNPNVKRDELSGETLAKSHLSSGRISLWVYDVSAGQWVDAGGALSPTVVRNKNSAVNEAFYNDYLFTTTLEESYSDVAKDVSNLYLKINVFYDEKKHDAARPLVNTHIGNIISFPLVNLVSSQSIVKEEMFFYKTGSTTEVDMANPVSVFTYKYNKGAGATDGNITDGNDIFFVFTKPPHVENY